MMNLVRMFLLDSFIPAWSNLTLILVLAIQAGWIWLMRPNSALMPYQAWGWQTQFVSVLVDGVNTHNFIQAKVATYLG